MRYVPSDMEKRTRLLALPNRIKALRLGAYLTVEELAEKAEVKPATIKRAEGKQVSGLHVRTARRIAHALGVDPSEITRVDTEEEAGVA